MYQALIEAMEHAIHALKNWPEKTIHLFHHNDADGLSSGAILLRAFERQGFNVQRFCIEKPYPMLLDKIYRMDGRIIVFADFAGRIAPVLSELNKGRNLTLILDHHVAEAATDPNVHNLDPDLYGLKGDRDISASTTCYLFACTLDPQNRDMAHMAAIGAVGDGFFVDGRLVDQNREAALEAQRQGILKIEEHASGERYILKSEKDDIPYDELAVYLELLGAVGYYRGGPDMGVAVCLDGRTEATDKMAADFKKIKTDVFNAEIERLRIGGLKKSSHIQYLHVHNRFSPMGVKMIGAFCQNIRNTDWIDPEKYIAGFQIIPNEIPGFGPMEFNQVKISMRVPAFLEDKIKAANRPGLDTFLPEATNRLGGFSDACHRLAAATTIAIGKEEQLIDEMDNILNHSFF
jgi:single-stranded-DNA-specific exonuclease